MINILIVGDKPSRLNKSQDVPFVGAKCFNRLLSWIEYLNCSFSLINSHDEEILKSITKSHKGKVLALGNNASKRLDRIKVKHLRIDHPSGLNRRLNSKKYVDNMLKTAYTYIHGDNKSGAV